jgi:hypothetical protein
MLPGKNIGVENIMKPFPHHSPLIHPLVGQPSAWHFITGHPVAVLVLIAWALQLVHFAVAIVRWGVDSAARELPRAPGSAMDARKYLSKLANYEGLANHEGRQPAGRLAEHGPSEKAGTIPFTFVTGFSPLPEQDGGRPLAR